MAKMKGVVVVNTERCKGCNLCVVACPLHVLSLTPKVNQKDIICTAGSGRYLQRMLFVRHCVPGRMSHRI